MTLRPLRDVNVPRTIVRITVAIAIAGAFLFTANVIDPDTSRATEGVVLPGPGPGPRAGAGNLQGGEVSALFRPVPSRALDSASERASLGVIESSKHTIQIYASSRGPLYTILDKSGAVLAEDLLADEVYTVFPELDVRSLIGSPSTTLADVPD